MSALRPILEAVQSGALSREQCQRQVAYSCYVARLRERLAGDALSDWLHAACLLNLTIEGEDIDLVPFQT